MTSKVQAMRDKLANLEGKNFDKAYMDHMVSDHKEDISLFEKASKNAKGQELKDFATRTLPTLKMHLDSAQAVYKSVR
jgi:putative membrane protein